MRALTEARFLLPFAIFWSTLDRAFVLPLVPVIAEEFDAPVAVAASAITVHALAYAILQLLWGPLSARWGRVRILAISTAIAALANLASAAAPDLGVFIAARAVSGGAFAATFAAVLVYLGDTLPVARRPAAMSNLATATALGLAVGTLGAVAVAEVASWRWVFAVFAVVAGALVVPLARLPDPGGGVPKRVMAQVLALARNPWAIGLYAITALEGFLLIGVFNLLPAALQQSGVGVFLSGLVTAAFGLAVVVISQLLKLVVDRVPAWALLAVAGACTAAAFGVLLVDVAPMTVLAAAALMGGAWAVGHTTIQTWMTDAAADARALGMTFFSISLMLGGALGAGLGALAIDRHAFPVLVAASLAASLVFGAVAATARSRYRVRGR